MALNRITALWCVPRSSSTAMERLLFETGLFSVLHEPFLYRYYLGLERRELPHFDVDPSHPTTFEGIKERIEEAARERPVLLKEMSYYVTDRLESDPDFFLGMTNTFLMRDPAETIASFFRVDPEMTREEIGHEALFRHVSFIERESGVRPVVVDAADLVADPAGLFAAYARAIGIPFDPSVLDWGDTAPEGWETYEGWHLDVAKSRGIQRTVRPATETEALFAANPKLRDFEAHHRDFYDRLQAYRLAPA